MEDMIQVSRVACQEKGAYAIFQYIENIMVEKTTMFYIKAHVCHLEKALQGHQASVTYQGGIMETEALSLIDADRYPVHLPESTAYLTLIQQCRHDIKTYGACRLPGFTTPDATRRMAMETDRVVHEAYPCRDTHNVYMEKDNDAFSEDHPRRRGQTSELDVIAYDQIDPGDGLYILYQWDDLLHFIAVVLEHASYYRMADPLAALTVNVMHEGQNHGWHFDEAEVTTTLMIRKPEEGGVFEYVHNLRTDDRNEYDQVNRALNDKHPDIQALEVEPGTLLIFSGYYSMHRVTPVKGHVTRYVATLCYKDQPNVYNSPEVQKLFYGRTA